MKAVDVSKVGRRLNLWRYYKQPRSCWASDSFSTTPERCACLTRGDALCGMHIQRAEGAILSVCDPAAVISPDHGVSFSSLFWTWLLESPFPGGSQRSA